MGSRVANLTFERIIKEDDIESVFKRGEANRNIGETKVFLNAIVGAFYLSESIYIYIYIYVCVCVIYVCTGTYVCLYLRNKFDSCVMDRTIQRHFTKS